MFIINDFYIGFLMPLPLDCKLPESKSRSWSGLSSCLWCPVYFIQQNGMSSSCSINVCQWMHGDCQVHEGKDLGNENPHTVTQSAYIP